MQLRSDAGPAQVFFPKSLNFETKVKIKCLKGSLLTSFNVIRPSDPDLMILVGFRFYIFIFCVCVLLKDLMHIEMFGFVVFCPDSL